MGDKMTAVYDMNGKPWLLDWKVHSQEDWAWEHMSWDDFVDNTRAFNTELIELTEKHQSMSKAMELLFEVACDKRIFFYFGGATLKMYGMTWADIGRPDREVMPDVVNPYPLG